MRTRIGEGARIGANSTLRCGVTVGRYAEVEPGSLVLEDVPDFAHAGGSPLRQLGWVCACGVPLDLPLAGEAHTVYACGQAYVLQGECVDGCVHVARG